MELSTLVWSFECQKCRVPNVSLLLQSSCKYHFIKLVFACDCGLVIMVSGLW